MNDFPLNPFLATIAEDFRLTVRDYERIGTVLRTGGPWSIGRLRDTLLALLAKNEAQVDVFLRRFKEFFKTDLERSFPDLDVQRALADLEQLAKGETIRVKPPKSAPEPPLRRVQPETLREFTARIGWWLAPSLLVIVVLMLAGYWFWPEPTPKIRLAVDKPTLKFGEQPLDSKSAPRTVDITNTGTDTLSLRLEIRDDNEDAVQDSGHFALDRDSAENVVTIPPGEALTLSVSFEGKSYGPHQALLVLTHENGTVLEQVTLEGSCPKPLEGLRPVHRWRHYPALPHLAIRQELSESMAAGLRYLSIACFVLLTVFVYGLWLWRSHRVPEDRQAYWQETGPRHFRPGELGGTPAPRLTDAVLAELADSMGYYRSEASGRILNVSASIEATGHAGGVPQLVFQRRKQIRSLLILEDTGAEASAWNPIARELAEGMRRRGVPVLYGHFSGSPARFRTEEGILHHLEDLDDQRRGYLLLVFSDGRGFFRRDSRWVLQDLARWPKVAWLELREPPFWDQTSRLPVAYGIPVYPATATGTVQALRRFLSEHGEQRDFAAAASSARGVPSQAGVNLDAHVEQLLGDALPWAQDCAMLQPISPGLADALRREFHPRLPLERIERLYALPGTIRNVAGLRFSDEVLGVLRTGFRVRREEQDQEAVLRFLLARVEAAEPTGPDEKNSLAHVAWESVRERLRLELEPGYALRRLAELAKTPLGPAIEAELETVGFPGQSDKIPLRVAPHGLHALQRLARLQGRDSVIPGLAAVSRWHWLVLGLLVAVVVGSGGWGGYRYFHSPEEMVWGVEGSTDALALLEARDEDGWRVEGMGSVGSLDERGLEPGEDYRLTVYGSGHRTPMELKAEAGNRLIVAVEAKEGQRPCQREAFPDTGVGVQICPEAGAGESETMLIPLWRERLGEEENRGRLLSVGLEVHSEGKVSPELREWRDRLLSTGSVDLIYRVDRASAEALADIRQHLGPLMARSQLVAWVEDAEFVEKNAGFFSGFDAAVNVNRGDGLAWISELAENDTMLADAGVVLIPFFDNHTALQILPTPHTITAEVSWKWRDIDLDLHVFTPEFAGNPQANQDVPGHYWPKSNDDLRRLRDARQKTRDRNERYISRPDLSPSTWPYRFFIEVYAARPKLCHQQIPVRYEIKVPGVDSLLRNGHPVRSKGHMSVDIACKNGRVRPGRLVLIGETRVHKVAMAQRAREQEGSGDLGRRPGDGTVMVIYDSSGKMWGRVDGRPKYLIARENFAHMIDQFADRLDLSLGLTAFGHRVKGDCDDIEQILAPRPLDQREHRSRLKAEVHRLLPRGIAPIARALGSAADMLKYSERPATVILISGSIEECGEDPCAMVEKLERFGIEFTAHLVGFDLSQEDFDRLRCVTDLTGGEALLPNDARTLSDALRRLNETIRRARETRSDR